jgi:hypothetical protein
MLSVQLDDDWQAGEDDGAAQGVTGEQAVGLNIG